MEEDLPYVKIKDLSLFNRLLNTYNIEIKLRKKKKIEDTIELS